MTNATSDRIFWRVSFGAPATAMPALLEELEDVAQSVAIFEDEVGSEAETLSWRVDLLFDARPEIAGLRSRLVRLCRPHGFAPNGLSLGTVAEEEWQRAMAARMPPVQVGRFVVHGEAAAEDVPPASVPVQVEAGMAFGSGEHATTQACLAAMELIAGRRPVRRVLDLGCGSGVLAIAAAKRWPARVVAADNDPVAVRVAAENAAINGVAGRVRSVLSEGWSSRLVRRRGPYDLVLANILADPLCAMAADLGRHLAPGGHAILSGFLEGQVEAVTRAHARHGLRPRFRVDRSPWVALVLRRWRGGG
jgi:ribosomal protein L11 methyltransferase